MFKKTALFLGEGFPYLQHYFNRHKIICFGFEIATKKKEIPKIQNIKFASWNQDYGHKGTN